VPEIAARAHVELLDRLIAEALAESRLGWDEIDGVAATAGPGLIGGLIVGVTENLAAGYFDPIVGGGTKDFAPYVLMIAALMIRPEGIFGRRRIERV